MFLPSEDGIIILPDELSLCRWTAHCHICTDPSPDAVNTSSLLGWKRRELTDPLCPVYWSNALPECIPHTIAVWSADAVPVNHNTTYNRCRLLSYQFLTVFKLSIIYLNNIFTCLWLAVPFWKRKLPKRRHDGQYTFKNKYTRIGTIKDILQD